MERLELLFNGEVLKSFPVGDGREAAVRERIPVERSGWFGLRALTEGPVHPIDDTNLHAETGAIYVHVGEQPIRSKEDAEYFVRWIDEITRQAREDRFWRSERAKEHVLAQFAEARAIYVQRAAEAEE